VLFIAQAPGLFDSPPEGHPAVSPLRAYASTYAFWFCNGSIN
jgi:hypothetical protein